MLCVDKEGGDSGEERKLKSSVRVFYANISPLKEDDTKKFEPIH